MMEQTEVHSDSCDQSYNLFSIKDRAGTPIKSYLTVNQKHLTMKLDTVVLYLLMSEQIYKVTQA